MNYRRQPFQFTAIDPAKRHAELQKRFGLPANEMYVESVNPEIMGGCRESSSVGNSPRLQHRVPVFNSSYDQEKPAQNVDSGHKPRVRVIPIQVEGVDAPMKRNRTFSGPAGSVKEVDPRQPSVHVQNELPNLFNTNETVKRPSRTRVCNIPVQIEPRGDKVAEKPKFEKNIEVNKVPSTIPKTENFNSKLPETNGCAASKVEDKSAEPDLNVPLKQIYAVLNKLKMYRQEVEKFSGSPKDKQYRYLDEMLTRCMLDLDDVETFGMDNIRQSRKAAIRQVQSCIDLLDTKVNAQTLQSNDVSMSESTTDTEFSKLEANSEPVIEEANEEKLSGTTAEEGSEVITEENSEPIIEEVQEDLSKFSAVEMCDDITESVVQEINPNSVVEEFVNENLTVDPSVESAPLVQEVEDSVSCDSVSGVEISEVVNFGVSELNSCGDVEMEEQPLLHNTTATVKEMEVSVSSEQETVIPTKSEFPLIVEPSDSLDLKQPCDSRFEQCLMEPDFSNKYQSASTEQFCVEELTNDSVNNQIIEQYSVEELSNDTVNNQIVEQLPTVIES